MEWGGIAKIEFSLFYGCPEAGNNDFYIFMISRAFLRPKVQKVDLFLNLVAYYFYHASA